MKNGIRNTLISYRIIYLFAGCSVSFSTHANRYKHMRNEHPASRMREFLCPIDGCNVRVGTKSRLLHHMKAHGLEPSDVNVQRLVHQVRAVGCKHAGLVHACCSAGVLLLIRDSRFLLCIVLLHNISNFSASAWFQPIGRHCTKKRKSLDSPATSRVNKIHTCNDSQVN